MTRQHWNLISTIDWVENYHLKNEDEFPLNSVEITEYRSNLSRIINEVQRLWELERKLREEFWTDIIYIDWYRVANAIGVAGTRIRREADSIILPHWETMMPTKTNLGWNIIDSIGFSSKVAAPSIWYWILGKIPQFRPNDIRFDEDLHNAIMSRLVTIQDKWIAFEVWKDEKAIMPVFSIDWISDLVSQFSDTRQESDTQTSKYYWINS